MNVTLVLTVAELRAVRDALDCPLSGDEDDATAVFGAPPNVERARSALRIVISALLAAEYRTSKRQRGDS